MGELERLSRAYDRWFADVTQRPIVRPPIPLGYAQRPAVELPAPEACFTGGISWYNKWGFAHDWLTGWSDPNDTIWWDVDVVTAGRYEVSLMYTCPPEAVGTKLRDLIAACGGLTEDAREVVNGGPMMGAAQGDLDTPVLKGTTGIVVLTDKECKSRQTYACIRCGHCLDACPVFLDPQLLGTLAGARRYEEMVPHHLWDCMLCGCCSYTCPSNIPLSQMFQLAKAALKKRKAA